MAIDTIRKVAAATNAFNTFRNELEKCTSRLDALQQQYPAYQEADQEDQEAVFDSAEEAELDTTHIAEEVLTKYSQQSFAAFRAIAGRLNKLTKIECVALRKEENRNKLKAELEPLLLFLDPVTWMPYVVDELSCKQAIILEQFFDAALKPEWLDFLPEDPRNEFTVAHNTLKSRIARYQATREEQLALTKSVREQLAANDQLMQPITQAILSSEQSIAALKNNQQINDQAQLNNALKILSRLKQEINQHITFFTTQTEKKPAEIKAILESALQEAQTSKNDLVFAPFLESNSIARQKAIKEYDATLKKLINGQQQFRNNLIAAEKSQSENGAAYYTEIAGLALQLNATFQTVLDSYFCSSRDNLVSHYQKQLTQIGSFSLADLQNLQLRLSQQLEELSKADLLNQQLYQTQQDAISFQQTNASLLSIPAFEATDEQDIKVLKSNQQALESQIKTYQAHIAQYQSFIDQQKEQLIIDESTPGFIKEAITRFFETHEAELKKLQQTHSLLQHRSARLADHINFLEIANDEEKLTQRLTELSKQKLYLSEEASKATDKLSNQKESLAKLQSHFNTDQQTLHEQIAAKTAAKEELTSEIAEITAQEEATHVSLEALKPFKLQCDLAQIAQRPDYELPTGISFSKLSQHMAWDEAEQNKWQDKFTYSQQINAWRGFNFTFARSYISSRPLPSTQALKEAVANKLHTLSEEKSRLASELSSKSKAFADIDQEQHTLEAALEKNAADFVSELSPENQQLSNLENSAKEAYQSLLQTETDLKIGQLKLIEIQIKKLESKISAITIPNNFAAIVEQQSQVTSFTEELRKLQAQFASITFDETAFQTAEQKLAIDFSQSLSLFSEHQSKIAKKIDALQANIEAKNELLQTKVAQKVSETKTAFDQTAASLALLITEASSILTNKLDPNLTIEELEEKTVQYNSLSKRINSTLRQAQSILQHYTELKEEFSCFAPLSEQAESIQSKIAEMQEAIPMLQQRVFEANTQRDKKKEFSAQEAALAEQESKLDCTKKEANTLLDNFTTAAKTYLTIRAKEHKWFDRSQRWFFGAASKTEDKKAKQPLADSVRRQNYLEQTLQTALQEFCNAIGTTEAQEKLNKVVQIINYGLAEFKPSSTDVKSDKYKKSLRHLLLNFAEQLKPLSQNAELKMPEVTLPATTSKAQGTILQTEKELPPIARV